MAMEFVALEERGVEVYTFTPGEEAPAKPTYTFPPVQTAEGCAWSSDGALLGLADSKTGGVKVLDAGNGYKPICEVPPLIGGPVRNFYFSPLGNLLVTHERYLKDAGNNVGVYDTKTGELRLSFILKQMTDMSWPPLKWTNLETHCCRMVHDGVLILPGTLEKGEGSASRIDAPGIMAFEVAPRGAGTSMPHVALCVAETKGAPARCQIFRLDAPEKPTAAKSFFKAQSVSMSWNNTGTSLLVKAACEVDDTGKNYYGGVNLYFMRADGMEDMTVAAAANGAVHDFQWNPMQDEFLLLHGDLPCDATIHSGKKGQQLWSFGKGHRNTIRFNTFGRFVTVGGYGQLLGDTDFWDKPGKTKLGTVRMECCVVSTWSPEGRHLLTATTHPRMRVDNKVVLYDYCGNKCFAMPFEKLLHASWRPRPRGAFQDRPPSPERQKAAGAAASKGGGKGGYAAAEPKKQAYRPPGSRGGGGLAELLRSELGSTSAGTSAGVATKAFGSAIGMPSLPPGASPDDMKQAGASGNNRNARKKKAKENAQQAAEQERLTNALAPSASAAAPPAKAAAPAAAPAAAAQEEQVSAAAGADNLEVEKKVRALRKKLRDIEKLKEKPASELDVLQRQKLDTEAEILQQIRNLGAEP
eukprot:TRINITY_DN28535_c0_g1_i1.p1 TRINITY_DN28535_c0_g1~~TRINITY_DN28535_c0_g1_i1.p1  ORF type:complete len:639 (-),score=160.65 TRINITY_DN28535_c0_g1_i1:72-1988(-)